MMQKDLSMDQEVDVKKYVNYVKTIHGFSEKTEEDKLQTKRGTWAKTQQELREGGWKQR